MLYSENIHFTGGKIVFTDKHGNKINMKTAVKRGLVRIVNWLADFKLLVVHAVSLHIPIWFLRKSVFKLVGLKIGSGSTIHMGCKFFDPSGVTIGTDTIIGDGTFLDGRDRLVIGDHVDIASQVLIYNSQHDINSPTFEATKNSVEVKDFVFIGPRAIILPGVKIGQGAIVAAGAVVTSDVPDLTLVGGVPAKSIGERKDKNPHYKLGRARLFQ